MTRQPPFQPQRHPLRPSLLLLALCAAGAQADPPLLASAGDGPVLIVPGPEPEAARPAAQLAVAPATVLVVPAAGSVPATPAPPAQVAAAPGSVLTVPAPGTVPATPAPDTQVAGDGDQPSFNPLFFPHSSDGQRLDLSRFSKGVAVLPGTYRADVYVNLSWQGRRDIIMRERADRHVEPCLDQATLSALGVDFSKLEHDGLPAQLLNDSCAVVGDVLPGATASFDITTLRLDVSIPQVYLRSTTRGWVDPKDWQSGEPAAGFLGYHASLYRSHTDTVVSGSGFLGLNAGYNVDGWRLRYNSAVSHSETSGDGDGQTHFQSIATYAQTDVTALRAQFTAGDAYTPGDIFTSVGYRGVQLSSDDRMQPDSLVGFAPVIRGIADTNAQVRVTQRGVTVYQATVAPGEFIISDLYNSGYAGDLDVTVTEADGRVKEFVVPYASVPLLLRQGMTRFSLLAGELRDAGVVADPAFAQASYQDGLTDDFTLYGGAQSGSDYQAVAAGFGFNTLLGAFSTDLTRSHAADLPAGMGAADAMTGESWRISYSKLMPFTSTNFTLASYLHSTANYLSIDDYARLRSFDSDASRLRNRLQLGVDQPLAPGWGRLFISSSVQSYWASSGNNLQYQAGWSNGYHWGSLTLTAGRTDDAFGDITTEYQASVTIPLGRAAHAPLLTGRASVDSSHDESTQLSVSGTAGNNNELAYSYGAGRASSEGTDGGADLSASMQYSLPVTVLSASMGLQGNDSQQSVGADGGIVFLPAKVVFSQPLGETFAVLEAPGAGGAAVSSGNGLRIGNDGYAVLPYLVPYHVNEVTLDPRGMKSNTDLEETSVNVVPRAGAIVVASFKTDSGTATLLHIRRSDGQSIPVGADILDAAGDVVGTVGQGGRTYLRGLDGQALSARWGDDGNHCQFSYTLRPGAETAEGYQHAEASCAMPAPQPGLHDDAAPQSKEH